MDGKSLDIAICTIKIDYLAFIKDLVIEEELKKYNINVIPMKAGFAIKTLDLKNYNKTDFHKYQRLIDKLIYLSCGIRSNIVFAIG